MTQSSLPALTSYQKQMLGVIDRMIGQYGANPSVIYSPARRWGKSLASKMVTSNAIAGANPAMIIMDEFADEWKPLSVNELRPKPKLEALGPEVVLDDPKWPGSRIEVWRKETDKRDPRNPNPKAGRIVSYEIRGEHAENERQLHTLDQARARAQMLHERAIKRVRRQMQTDNPMFGRF
jgi:hypothetical protein